MKRGDLKVGFILGRGGKPPMDTSLRSGMNVRLPVRLKGLLRRGHPVLRTPGL